MRRRRVATIVGLLVLPALTTIAPATAGTPAFAGTRASAGIQATAGASTRQRLRVLTLNIFYGGDDLDLSTGTFCEVPDGCPRTLRRIEQLIRQTGADVVGIQEPERNTERIAAALGWYGSNQAHVMSRFPILNPPGANGLYVYLEVRPGKVVAFADTHLPSDPYGPYLVRDGGTLTQVLDLERTVRVPAVNDLTRELPRLAARNIPVLLTGDFNSPSHLDWTPAVSRVRDVVRYPVVWPASLALARAGLHDTYREAHPDPVAVPGFTWTPGGPETDPHEVQDRIDWVLRAGPSRTIDSTVVGEVGGPDVGIAMSPYPTDHRGILSTVEVRPATTPVLVSPQTRRVRIGQQLAVRYHLDGRSSHGGDAMVALRNATGRIVAARRVRASDGQMRLDTRALSSGRAEVVALDGRRTVALSPVWAYPPGTPTRVSVDRDHYRPGQDIGVRWSNAPGMGLDWVSVFRCSNGSCADDSAYLVYAYTASAVQGSTTIGAGSIDGNESWPLPTGTYVVRLLPDDGLRSVAQSSRFTIG